MAWKNKLKQHKYNRNKLCSPEGDPFWNGVAFGIVIMIAFGIFYLLLKNLLINCRCTF